MSILLSSIVLIPIIGSLLILISPDSEIEQGKYHKSLNIKQIALITSLINFFISLFIWYQFDSNTIQYQFVSEFNQLSFCHLNFGVDGISLYFVLLTTFVTPISLYEISLESQKLLWLGFFLAFAVKTPLYPFIIWLPKAHADSPLAGSIILAATILKLATYGYLRVLINFLPDATNYFNPLVQTVAVIAIIYASFSTIIQQDTKRLIAYSSIAHMGVVVLGLFSNTIQGIEGAILLALAHGFVSPGLFICVGGIIYDRTGTRIINYIRGLVTYMPVFTILFFIFTIANTGIPLSLNFLGEQLSLIGIWQNNPIIAALGATGIILSACYSLFLYNRLSYGNLSPLLTPIKDLNRREYYLLISLIIPTILFGILPNILLDSLHTSVSALLFC